MIDKPLPFKGRNIRIPSIIPTKGGGFRGQMCNFQGMPPAIGVYKGLGFRVYHVMVDFLI